MNKSCMCQCKAFWADVFLLVFVLAPAMLMAIGAGFGWLLSVQEGWSFDIGFWYVSSTMSGQPNSFVSQSPQTALGYFGDVLISIYSIIASTLIVGLVAMLSNVASLNDLPILKSNWFGVLVLLVILPCVALMLCCAMGIFIAFFESWDFSRGLRYTVSAVTGASLENTVPSTYGGRFTAIVIGVLDEGLFGALIGLVSSIGFIERFIHSYEFVFFGDKETDDDAGSDELQRTPLTSRVDESE